jgi:hypothetical protein
MGGSVTITEIVDPEGWENYRGRWVAIRGDEIIAAAVELDDLVADERVARMDGVWRVPEAGIHFYSDAGPS